MHLYSLELQFARVQNPPKYIKIWLYIGLCIYQLRDQEEEYKNKLFLVFSSTVRTLTGSTIRMCYWCRALCQLLRIAMPSLSPSEAQGCGEAHTHQSQQPHTQTFEQLGFGSCCQTCSHCQAPGADPCPWVSAGSALLDVLWAEGFAVS